MSARPTATARRHPAPGSTPSVGRPDRRPAYRLLHSSGDRIIQDRAAALERLARLPGAKLFVLVAPTAAAPQ